MKLPKLVAAAAAVLTVGVGLAVASPLEAPHYIGSITGNPERDTFGSVVQSSLVADLCLVGTPHYFGPVSRDMERNTYGYATVLVPHGQSCPQQVASAK